MCAPRDYDRIVLCEACGSEGRIQHVTGFDWHDGSPTGWEEPCPYCEGTGGEIIVTEPIELEDLSET